MFHRFIYVLPVIQDVDLNSSYGDGLEELRTLNVHNDYNAHIIAPSFKSIPWYADHAFNPDRQYESFVVRDLVPWVEANLSTTGLEEHWLVGFSKSGFGAVTLLFRNPAVFDAAAAWDFPADQSSTSAAGMLSNYGTDTNFQNNYRLTAGWIAARKDPFQTATRLWLSRDYVATSFLDQVLAFAGRLQANDVQYLMTGGATRVHSWTSGWLGEALAGLQSMRYTARDDFNRPDGDLGSNWTRDPFWGAGLSISGNHVGSPISQGGAYYWNANIFGDDQFSQVKLTGAVGDWTGVSVRGGVLSAQGYWVAIKPDGAYLYSFLNDTFSQLAHDATTWATGDVVRLEVRTVAANTARLTAYLNGRPLFTYDDTAYFIGSGHPGIGLYASAPMSLDDWQGGELNPGAPVSPVENDVAYWKFDEGSGTTAADSSGNGNVATLNGPTWASGEIGGALNFDGVNDYVSVPDASSLDNTSALTIAFWVKPTILDGSPRGIVSKRTAPSIQDAYSVFFSTGNRLFVDIDTSNDRFSTNTVFLTNTWYHVAVTYDGTLALASRVNVYVNGVRDKTAGETSASIPNYGSSLTLGKLGGTTSYFAGSLDDVRIYNRALTATEVSSLFYSR
jgi:concanavalin A-like lectin/glucanase superfamily protein/putative esterase